MPFQLPNQTSFATAKPTYSGSTWVRPVDWLTIVDAPNEVQFLVSDVVFPVYTIQTTFTRPAAQNIYIDWGDGVVDTISTIGLTSTNHTYTSGGTPSTLGYNMWKIRIYGDAGAVITLVKQQTNTTYWGSATQGQIGILEAYYGSNLSSLSLADLLSTQNFPNVRMNFLEYVKLPNTTTTTSLGGMFRNSNNLRKVDFLLSASTITNTQDTFNGCRNLQEVILPNDMVNILLSGTMFANCQALVKVILPPTLNSLTDCSGMFSSCQSLGSIQFPNTNNCGNFSGMFDTCRLLLDVKIPSCSQSLGVNFNTMFANCSSLESVLLPSSVGSGTTAQFAGTFQNCSSLKFFNGFPTNLNVSNFNSTFQNCNALANVIFPSSIPLLDNLLNTFNNCRQLTQITLPNVVAASIGIQNCFNGCSGISEITIPSSYNINNYQLAFSNMTALKKLTLPPNMTGGFFQTIVQGCINLQEIVMATNASGTTTMNGTFSSCSNLTSITLPNLPNLTSLTGTFQGTDLTSLTFGTLGVNGSIASAFFSMPKIKSITLPATITPTSYNNTFNNCFSLTGITLPTAQSTNLLSTGLNTAFGNIDNCEVINNTDKIGNPSTAAGNTTYVDGTNLVIRAPRLSSLDFTCKFAKFQVAGIATLFNGLTSLRLRNNGAGQYAGTSPQVDIKYNKLGQAALVQVFNDLPTITAKTIDITSNPGAALLTGPERAIATGKGWTIVG